MTRRVVVSDVDLVIIEPEPMSTQTKVIEVWSDTRSRVVPCQGCRAPITFIEIVKSGKRMPFTGEPVALTTRHDPATHRVIETVDLDDNHWSTCPKAKDFR